MRAMEAMGEEGLFAGDHETRPLAERMRPRTLEELLGQDHLLGEGAVLSGMIARGELRSLLLWGPPGSGKTTLAWILARRLDLPFVAFSAVTSGIAEVRKVTEQAATTRRLTGKPTLLFVDEIHRFHRGQQDAFLPHVESGRIVLVGATTENPSFEVNAALLSRCMVFVLRPLGEEDLGRLVDRALADRERGLGRSRVSLDPAARSILVGFAGGDARVLLNTLEVAALAAGRRGGAAVVLDAPAILAARQKRVIPHDKDREGHYDLISALHKSLRGSDVDATLYWLARMLEGGEDRRFLCRRLVRAAIEDVGLADPRALEVALAARDAFEFLGSPEGDLAIAEAAIYLAAAPKSDATLRALEAARDDVRHRPLEPPPLHLLNAPTRLMRDLGHGQGYVNPHRVPDGIVGAAYRPGAVEGRRYYVPGRRGEEAGLAQRLEDWRRRHGAARGNTGRGGPSGGRQA